MFQGGLGKAQKLIGAFENTVPKIVELLDATGNLPILDLCSGSGEISLHLRELIEREGKHELHLILTDLFPDAQLLARQCAKRPKTTEFYTESVDVHHPPDPGPHVRSILATLHHFEPEQVREILQDAALHSEGIFILESTHRSWLSLLQALPLPIPGAILCGLCLRPWRISHLLWSFLVPVLPLVILWDSLVSNFRSYTVEELKALTRSIDAPDFTWDIGMVKMARANLWTTYVIGRKTSYTAPLDKSTMVAK